MLRAPAGVRSGVSLGGVRTPWWRRLHPCTPAWTTEAVTMEAVTMEAVTMETVTVETVTVETASAG